MSTQRGSRELVAVTVLGQVEWHDNKKQEWRNLERDKYAVPYVKLVSRCCHFPAPSMRHTAIVSDEVPDEASLSAICACHLVKLPFRTRSVSTRGITDLAIDPQKR